VRRPFGAGDWTRSKSRDRNIGIRSWTSVTFTGVSRAASFEITLLVDVVRGESRAIIVGIQSSGTGERIRSQMSNGEASEDQESDDDRDGDEHLDLEMRQRGD